MNETSTTETKRGRWDLPATRTARYMGIGLPAGKYTCCLCGITIQDVWPDTVTTIIYLCEGERVFAHSACAGVEWEAGFVGPGQVVALCMVELPKDLTLGRVA